MKHLLHVKLHFVVKHTMFTMHAHSVLILKQEYHLMHKHFFLRGVTVKNCEILQRGPLKRGTGGGCKPNQKFVAVPHCSCDLKTCMDQNLTHITFSRFSNFILLENQPYFTKPRDKHIVITFDCNSTVFV